MWMRASGLRRGFTSQFDSADIIDDMAAAAPGGLSFRPARRRDALLLRLLAFVYAVGRVGVDAVLLGRGPIQG
jgi:hypothetical protein